MVSISEEKEETSILRDKEIQFQAGAVTSWVKYKGKIREEVQEETHGRDYSRSLLRAGPGEW